VRNVRLVTAVLLAVGAVLGVTAHAGARTTKHQSLSKTCGSLSSGPATYAHVIWIWMENHSYNQIIGPAGSTAESNSPYVNDTLAPACGVATNYHNVTHPSLPNYLAATSGSTQGLAKDCSPTKCSNPGPSLFGQLKSWRGYDESMPSNCYTGNTSLYAARHNPAVYYTALGAACKVSDVQLGTMTSGSFGQDLAKNTLPSFSFVTPNLCNDTHGCAIHVGDTWLSQWVPKITSSPAYQSGNTVLFVTWDEGSGGTSGESCSKNSSDKSCQVATLVVSPYTAVGTKSSTAFDHYSLLRTTEELLGVPRLGHAADATTASMRSAFHL